MLIALTSCKTIEIAHDPLRCLTAPLPSLSDNVSLSDLDSLSDESFTAIETHIVTLRTRIDVQCDLINKHNVNHSKNEAGK